MFYEYRSCQAMILYTPGTRQELRYVVLLRSAQYYHIHRNPHDLKLFLFLRLAYEGCSK